MIIYLINYCDAAIEEIILKFKNSDSIACSAADKFEFAYFL
jgi:hypothetical protein